VGIVLQNPEFLTHPIISHNHLCNRDALYGVRNEALRLHYKVLENEAIQYVYVLILYPYICKYFKFPLSHSFIHVGDSFKEKEACLRMNGLIKYYIVCPERL